MSTGRRSATVEVGMSVRVLMVPTLPHDPAELGRLTELRVVLDRVLADLPARPTLVVLSTGHEPLVEEVTTLALSDRTVPVAGAPELVAAIVERGQVPRVQAAALGGRPAVLAATVHAARPESRCVGVTIPGLADPAAIEGATVALRGALAAADDVVLVVHGDLGPAAPEGTRRVRDALLAHDMTALARVATDHPELAGVLAPVRLALGVAPARARRLVIDGEVLLNGVLHVVGSAG